MPTNPENDRLKRLRQDPAEKQARIAEDLTLINTLARERARRLLAGSSDYF